MNVLLIWPFQKGWEIKELFPLGLGYLAANIDKDKYNLKILDCVLDNMHPFTAEFRDVVQAFNPDVIGISFWSKNAGMVRLTSSLLRNIAPKAKIVFGGPHVTVQGKYELNQGHCDYIIECEAEYSFPRLLDSIKYNSDIVSIPYYENNLDLLGKVDYGVLRLPEYHASGYKYCGNTILHPELKSALIIATRGCPYSCRFCSAPLISGRKIRTHSPAYIAKTIKNLYENFYVRIIAFGDDNITLNTNYASSVFEAIIDLKLKDLVLSIPNGIRMTNTTPELQKIMKQAGVEELTISPESGSQRVLELMDKILNLWVVSPFVSQCHNAGLKVRANFIVGYPGETIDDLLMTEQFIKENEFDQIGVSFFQPLPGTPIYNDLIDRGEITQFFIPGNYKQLTYCTEGVDKEEVCKIYNRIVSDFSSRKGLKNGGSNMGVIR